MSDNSKQKLLEELVNLEVLGTNPDFFKKAARYSVDPLKYYKDHELLNDYKLTGAIIDKSVRDKRFQNLSIGEKPYAMVLWYQEITIMGISFDVNDNTVNYVQIQGRQHTNNGVYEQVRDTVRKFRFDRFLIDYSMNFLIEHEIEKFEMRGMKNDPWVLETYYELQEINAGEKPFTFSMFSFYDFLQLNEEAIKPILKEALNAGLSKDRIHLLPHKAKERYDENAYFFGFFKNREGNFEYKVKK